MANNENNILDIENILQNNRIFISLSECGEGDLKKIIQNNIQYMSKYPGAFCVFQFDIESADAALKLVIDMLVSRKILGIIRGQNFEEVFTAIANTGKKKIYLAVRNRKQYSEIIEAGKKARTFIDLCKLNEDGSIDRWSARKDEHNNSKNNADTNVNHREKPYVINKASEKIDVRRICVTNQVEVGSVIFDSVGKEYKLVEKVLSNNGAITYRTDVNGIWVKLYDNDSLNTFIESKINRMVKDPINIIGVCWPLGIAVDAQKNFRGYFMNEVVGEPLHLSVMKKAGIEKYFPNWDKINLCILVLTILDKIDRLHKKGILMGCINPAAIRVIDDSTVCFTDTDNYQVEGYPSFVYNISFTPPELLDKKIYLTNVDSENFAIAELVFMIMMTGKTPYAIGINGDPKLEIKKMNFPYSNRKVHGNAALPSMWRFMWSHLTPYKEPFYETFQKEARYNKQGNRRGIGFWIKLTKDFKEDLETPVDRESLRIYPRTFKRSKNETFYRCRFCGVEHPRFYFNDQFFDEYQICNDCIGKQSNVSFDCVDCKKTYYYTNRTALFHKQKKEQDTSWKDQKHCRDCKRKTLNCSCCRKEVSYYQLRDGMCPDCNSNYKKQVYERIQCKICGRTFDFTNGDREFYAKKGYSLPNKCTDCRNGGRQGVGNNFLNNTGGDSHRSLWSKLFGN